PYYWLSAAFRGSTIVALTIIVWRFGDARGTFMFATVAGMLFLISSFGAIGLIPFMTIVSDSMPASSRGRFFGTRWLLGGLVGMCAGFVVKWILSEDSGLIFPMNYVCLFGSAAVLYTIAVLIFSLVKEPRHTPQSRQLTLRQELARGPRLIRRDSDWRLLLGARVSGMIAAGMSLPYLVPFALERLEAPQKLIGVLLSVMAASSAGANLIWSRLGDRRGNRALLMAASTLAVAPSVIALSCYFVPDVALGVWFGIPMTTRLLLLILAFVPMGCAKSGMAMGQTNFLLDIAPNRRRSTYLGYSFVLMAPLAWWPVVGALIIGNDRFGLAFALAACSAMVTVFLVSRLREPRAEDLAHGGGGPPLAAGGQ
ncbi:MAG TPA: hypothetical protein QGH10_06320, partial [Armatimonadota bacterium]|nr:hypothetical protein [Armatimonadota bacterium]